MNERVQTLRKALNLSQAEFGEKIGLKQTSVSSIEINKCKLSNTLILMICSKFNVNENWLRTGEGNMFNEEKSFDDFLIIFKKLNPILQDFLIESAKNLLDAQNKL